MFQSTRPRGARLRRIPFVISSSSFNPRARVGRDHAESAQLAIFKRFNPRARVGRDQINRYSWLSYRFQSTRPRGARLYPKKQPVLFSVSIHAPAWGATTLVAI